MRKSYFCRLEFTLIASTYHKPRLYPYLSYVIIRVTVIELSREKISPCVNTDSCRHQTVSVQLCPCTCQLLIDYLPIGGHFYRLSAYVMWQCTYGHHGWRNLLPYRMSIKQNRFTALLATVYILFMCCAVARGFPLSWKEVCKCAVRLYIWSTNLQ